MVVVRFRQPDGGTVEVVFTTRGGGIFDPPGDRKRAVVRPRLNLPIGFWDTFVAFVKESNERAGTTASVEDVFVDMATDYMAVTRARLDPAPPPTPTTKKTKPKEDKGTLVRDKKKGWRYKTDEDE